LMNTRWTSTLTQLGGSDPINVNAQGFISSRTDDLPGFAFP
jgi:hypothetical protein